MCVTSAEFYHTRFKKGRFCGLATRLQKLKSKTRMEAIDDSLNENIARSIAYSVLEYRQQHEFNALTPLCSKLLQQRIRFLGPPSGDEGWNSVIQWQEDDCPEVIDTCWSPNMQDKLYQQPVYYKRLDAETLNCVVEFAVRDKMHYAVMLVLEPDTADTSDLKYHNTRAYSQSEWKDIVHSWSRSLEHAEREFVRLSLPLLSNHFHNHNQQQARIWSNSIQINSSATPASVASGQQHYEGNSGAIVTPNPATGEPSSSSTQPMTSSEDGTAMFTIEAFAVQPTKQQQQQQRVVALRYSCINGSTKVYKLATGWVGGVLSSTKTVGA